MAGVSMKTVAITQTNEINNVSDVQKQRKVTCKKLKNLPPPPNKDKSKPNSTIFF
jgi:hypothetical protein